MTVSQEILRREGAAPDAPAAAAALLEPILTEAAGPDAAPLSLTLDYAAAVAADEPVVAEAWVDRATRSLVFAHGRLTRPDGTLIASGSAVFRRAAQA